MTVGETVVNKQKKSKSRLSKAKRKSAKKKQEKKEVAEIKRSDRNYSTELLEYIEAWKQRESGSGWKFNKVLQNWAIDNVFDKALVKKVELKPVLSYMATIQGAARERLLVKAKEIIESNDDEIKKGLVRATKILHLFPEEE